MAEFALVDQAVAFAYAMLGGAAGVLILNAAWQAYHAWSQTNEAEKQTELQFIEAEATLLILERLRGHQR